MLQLHLESFDDLRFYTKDHFYREALSRMIARFLKTGHFEVEPGRNTNQFVQMSLTIMLPLL